MQIPDFFGIISTLPHLRQGLLFVTLMTFMGHLLWVYGSKSKTSSFLACHIRNLVCVVAILRIVRQRFHCPATVLDDEVQLCPAFVPKSLRVLILIHRGLLL